jgi:hypothetical protein
MVAVGPHPPSAAKSTSGISSRRRAKSAECRPSATEDPAIADCLLGRLVATQESRCLICDCGDVLVSLFLVRATPSDGFRFEIDV